MGGYSTPVKGADSYEKTAECHCKTDAWIYTGGIRCEAWLYHGRTNFILFMNHIYTGFGGAHIRSFQLTPDIRWGIRGLMTLGITA
jgi:hypothetical protein